MRCGGGAKRRRRGRAQPEIEEMKQLVHPEAVLDAIEEAKVEV